MEQVCLFFYDVLHFTFILGNQDQVEHFHIPMISDFLLCVNETQVTNSFFVTFIFFKVHIYVYETGSLYPTMLLM